MGLISAGSTIFDAGSMSAGFGGSMVFIKKLTASSSGTLSFVDGASSVVLDNTYKEYLFTFKDIHPATNTAYLTFQSSTDTGSSYGVAITSTAFYSRQIESGGNTELDYNGSADLAQGTGFQRLSQGVGNGGDETCSGTLHLFNPSSTTFAKHFIARMSNYQSGDYIYDQHTAGYINTTSAVDAIQFKFSSGNIDAGDICLYGIA